VIETTSLEAASANFFAQFLHCPLGVILHPSQNRIDAVTFKIKLDLMDAEQNFRCIMGALILACFIQLLPAVILFFMFKILGDVMTRIQEDHAAALE
jgi:hypothetical protein